MPRRILSDAPNNDALRSVINKRHCEADVAIRSLCRFFLAPPFALWYNGYKLVNRNHTGYSRGGVFMGLFKPIWMTDNPKKLGKATKAVEKVKSEDQLFEIATTAPFAATRIRATERISDQRMLYQIALTKEAKYSDVQRGAIERITDQELLKKLANEASVSKKVLFKRISDERFLVQIAVETKDFYLGNAAFDCLRSQKAFADVALNAKNDHWREMAVRYRLTDQAALLQVAQNEPNDDIRAAAIVKLDDPALLTEYADVIAGYLYGYTDVCEAVKKINDAMALLIIASGTHFDTVQALCLDKLNKPGLCSDARLDVDRLNKIVLECEDNAVCAAARKRLKARQGAELDGEVAAALRNIELIEAADQGKLEALAIDPAASLEALSSEFQKFIDGYTKEPVSISFDDHFRSRGLEKIKRFARIGAGLRFLHDQAGMAAQVEARFPERQYSCTYEWSEYGVDGGDAIECDSVELIALWGK